MTDEKKYEPITVLMSRVMADMKAISKNNHNAAQGYAFRGIDDVMNELQPVLVDHGVFCVPEEIQNEHEWRQTKNGGWQHSTILRVKYRFYGPAGDSIPMETVGESADTSDKSTQQAMSQALKTGLLQTFCIRTQESAKDDPDSKSPEAGGPPQSPQQQQRPVKKPQQLVIDLTDRIKALPTEDADVINKRIADNNFPSPLPAGAVRTVTKWIEEAELKAPF